MNNIDKEKINNSINEAYEKQSKKVKELLQSAKENLADQKECTYNYVTNKEKANQLYKISRVVSRKKQDENGIENKLEDKFNEMSEKIDISSKNLNFIFENVTQNNNNIMRKVDEIKDNNEELTSKLVRAQLDAEKRMVEAQNNAFEKMMQKNNNSEDNSSEILEGQEKLKEELANRYQNIEKNIEAGQRKYEEKIVETQNILAEKIDSIQLNDNTEIAQEVLKGQNKVQETLLDSHASMENSTKIGQKESERRIIQAQGILEEKIEAIKVQNENKLQEIKAQNENQLEEIKTQIYKMYQKENKHTISTLLEERNSYMKELEEKDREIRELNYKIYAYEEKLEKEMAKRERVSIFAPFFRKQTIQEEEPVYTSQILNYVYN